MFGSFHLFTVRQVPIRIHFTTVLLIPMVRSENMSSLGAVLFIIILLLSVGLHELGHTIIAQRYGVHVQDIILTPIGGVARLRGLPQNPHQEIRIALAGPYVSLFLALLFGLLIFPLALLGIEPLTLICLQFSFLNFGLLLFNMLPSFPMDGGRVLRGYLSIKKGPLEATRIATTIGKGISILFIFLGLLISQWSLVIIGGFILLAAGSEYKMMQFKSWANVHAQNDHHSELETDFEASPPPYAKQNNREYRLKNQKRGHN